VGPTVGLDDAENILDPTGTRSSSPQPVAIPTELSRLHPNSILLRSTCSVCSHSWACSQIRVFPLISLLGVKKEIWNCVVTLTSLIIRTDRAFPPQFGLI
jgi:hypothetical protein